jgi:hypothetical protein
MSNVKERRAKKRKRAASILAHFPNVKGAKFLEHLSNLPTSSPVGNLRRQAMERFYGMSKKKIRESFNDLSKREVIFCHVLQKNGMPYREIEPIVGLKNMNGMNAHRAIHYPKGKAVIKEYNKEQREKKKKVAA